MLARFSKHIHNLTALIMNIMYDVRLYNISACTEWFSASLMTNCDVKSHFVKEFLTNICLTMPTYPGFICQ